MGGLWGRSICKCFCGNRQTLKGVYYEHNEHDQEENSKHATLEFLTQTRSLHDCTFLLWQWYAESFKRKFNSCTTQKPYADVIHISLQHTVTLSHLADITPTTSIMLYGILTTLYGKSIYLIQQCILLMSHRRLHLCCITSPPPRSAHLNQVSEARAHKLEDSKKLQQLLRDVDEVCTLW